MKKILLSALLWCGLSVAAADPYFKQATGHVDFGGESLTYNNISGLMAKLNSGLPDICSALSGDEKTSARSRDLLNLLIKLWDLKSFRAVATSSLQAAPDVFVYKQALIVAPESNSILLSLNEKNHPLDWQNLPADTRLAVSTALDIPRTWERIKLELAASGNPDMQAHMMAIEMLKSQGIDLDELLNSVRGNFSLLVTGDTINAWNIKISIPDIKGNISAQLKNDFPPAPGSNFFEMPAAGRRFRLIYSDKAVVIVSDPKLLAPPAQKLGSLPKFREYAKYLPADGCGYYIIDIPQAWTDFFSQINQNPALKFKPFSFVAVSSKIPDGEKMTAVSDFSFIQAQFSVIMMNLKMLKNRGLAGLLFAK